ncbi:MAG TPA: hypothetical protein VGG72_28400 [Bryobacteraceae bacterium]|jgi:hypothetical protein
MSDSCFLDIYGYRALVASAPVSVLSGIREDFAFFEKQWTSSAESVAVRIEIFQTEPPYDRAQHASAPVFTPRNVSFRSDGTTFLDYSGRALGIHDPQKQTFQVYSLNADLLYEVTYLFLLSQTGEFFDAHDRHRVHALCVSIASKAALVLLPMGGGKSTLGSQLLRFPDIKLLSDDSPLIDGNGKVWAFPLRIGLLPGFEGTIPPEQFRKVERMEFGPKLLMRYACFADRVIPDAEPCLLFLGSRSLRAACEISRASKSAALHSMAINCIIGIGLFQGMEFVFQRGWMEVFRKAVTALSRLRASFRLIARSEVYNLTLGRDLELNAQTLVEFIRRQVSESPSNRP